MRIRTLRRWVAGAATIFLVALVGLSVASLRMQEEVAEAGERLDRLERAATTQATGIDTGADATLVGRDLGRAARTHASLELDQLQGNHLTLQVATVIVVGIMLVGLSLAFVYLRWAVWRPLDSLSLAAEGVARGNYDARAMARAPNELGLVGRIFNDMASSIAITTDQRAQVEEELERLDGLDALTALPTRAAFEEAARRELSRVRRRCEPSAVLMVDVDHLAQLNDRHGDDTGDRVLRELAYAIRSQVRDVDIVGRLRGAEVAVVLSGTSRQAAVQMAERLRDSIAKRQIIGVNGSPVHFTISIGVAEMSPATDDVGDVLEHAESALYDAKREGRNQVVVWEVEHPADSGEEWARLSGPPADPEG